jgi:hypothetical protein
MEQFGNGVTYAGHLYATSPTNSWKPLHLNPNLPRLPAQGRSVDSFAAEADHLAAHERLYDDLFTRIREDLLADQATQTDEQRARLSLTESNGLLWRNNFLYIPDKDTLRQDVLYWHHDVPWMAHLGVQKTVKMVSAQFYWPLMQSDIEQYIETCHKYQSTKTDRRRNVPALSPLVPPTSCWRTVGVDLIVDLPQSQCGFNAVCVFVDHLSKMAAALKPRRYKALLDCGTLLLWSQVMSSHPRKICWYNVGTMLVQCWYIVGRGSCRRLLIQY